MGPQEDYIETVVTCEGDFYDPGFSDRLQSFQDELKSLLLKDKRKQLVVKKVEPWNSVKVTLNIPKNAALRLKWLAEQDDPTLRRIGVLGVQFGGDRLVTQSVATPSSQRAELAFGAVDASQTASAEPPVSAAGAAGHVGRPEDTPGPGPGVNSFQDQSTSHSKVVHPSAEANRALLCTKSHLQSKMNNSEYHAYLEMANTSGFHSHMAASLPTPSASFRLAAPPAIPAGGQNFYVQQPQVQPLAQSPCMQQTVTAPFPSQPGSLQMARMSLHMAAEAGYVTSQQNIVPPLQPTHEKGTKKAGVRKRKKDQQESNVSSLETNNNALAAEDKPKKRACRRRTKNQMAASGSVDDGGNAVVENSNRQKPQHPHLPPLPFTPHGGSAEVENSNRQKPQHPHLPSLPFTPHGGSAEVMGVQSAGANYRAEGDSLINPHTGIMEPRNSSPLSGTSTLMHIQPVVTAVDRSPMLPSPCASSSPHPPSCQFLRAEPPTRPDLVPAGQGRRTMPREAWDVEQYRSMASQMGSYQPSSILHLEPQAKRARLAEHLMNDHASVAQPMETDVQMFHTNSRGNLTSVGIESGAREFTPFNSSPSGSSSRLFSDCEDNSSSQSPISHVDNMMLLSPLQDAQGKQEHQDSGIGSQSDRSVDTISSDSPPHFDPSVAGKPLMGSKKLMNSEVKKEPVMPAGYMPTCPEVTATFSNFSKAIEHHSEILKQKIGGCQEVASVKQEPDFGTPQSCALVNSRRQEFHAKLKAKIRSPQRSRFLPSTEQNRPTAFRQAFSPQEPFPGEQLSGASNFNRKGSPAMNTESFSLPTSPLTVRQSVPFSADNLYGPQQTVGVWPKSQSMAQPPLQKCDGGRQVVSEQKSLQQVTHEKQHSRMKKECWNQRQIRQLEAQIASYRALCQQRADNEPRPVALGQRFPQQIVQEQKQPTLEQKLLPGFVHEQTQATSMQKSCQNAHGQAQLTSGRKSLQILCEQVQPTVGQKPFQQIVHGQAQKALEQNGARAEFEGGQQHTVSREELYPPSLAAANRHGQFQRPQSQGHPELHRPQSQGHLELQRPQSQGHPQLHRPQSQGHPELQRPQSQGHPELHRPQSQGHPQLQRPQSQGHLELQRPQSQGHPQLHRPQSQGHPELQRPQSQGHPQLQRPQSQGHLELQRPLSVPHGNNSFPLVPSGGSRFSSAPYVESPYSHVPHMSSPRPSVYGMGSPQSSVYDVGSPHPSIPHVRSPYPSVDMGSPHSSDMGSPHPSVPQLGSVHPSAHNVKSPFLRTSVRSPHLGVSGGASQHAAAPVRSPYPAVPNGNMSHQSVPYPISQLRVLNHMSHQSVPNTMSRPLVPNPMLHQSVPNTMSRPLVPNPMLHQSVPNTMSKPLVPNPMLHQSVPNTMSRPLVPNHMSHQSVPNPISQQLFCIPMSPWSIHNPMSQQHVPDPMSQQHVPDPMSQQSGLKRNRLGMTAALPDASDHSGTPQPLSRLVSIGKERGLASVPGRQGQQRRTAGEQGIPNHAYQSGEGQQPLNTACGSVGDMKQSQSVTACSSVQNNGIVSDMKQSVAVTACGSEQNNSSVSDMRQSVAKTAACGSCQSSGSDITTRQSAAVTLEDTAKLVEDKHHPALPADSSVVVNQPLDLEQCSSTSSQADAPESTAEQSSAAALAGDFSFLDNSVKAAAHLDGEDLFSALEGDAALLLFNEIDVDKVIDQLEKDEVMNSVPLSDSPATSSVPPVAPSHLPAGTSVGGFPQDESAGLPQPRNLTESVQRVVQPLPAQDQHLSPGGIASTQAEAGTSLPCAHTAASVAAGGQTGAKAALDASGLSTQKSSPLASWPSGSAAQQGVASPMATPPTPHLQGSMQSFPVAKNNIAAAAAPSTSFMGAGAPPPAPLEDAASTLQKQTKGKTKKNGQPRKKKGKQQ